MNDPPARKARKAIGSKRNAMQTFTPQMRDELIKALGSLRREEREAGSGKLRSLGCDPLTFLLSELDALPAIPQWQFSVERATRNFAQFCVETILYLSAPTDGDDPRFAPTFSEETRYRRRIGLVLRGLAWSEDLRVIGPLCERLREADEDAQWRAQLTLKNLLPRLQSSDAALFTEGQKKGLYALLHTNDAVLRVAALKAIGHIGGGCILPEVEAQAHSPDLTIRQAALEALPALRERARREAESQTLLRGACAPPTGGDVLLRPAPPVHSANPAEMLRAVGPEPNSHSNANHSNQTYPNQTHQETNFHAEHRP